MVWEGSFGLGHCRGMRARYTVTNPWLLVRPSKEDPGEKSVTNRPGSRRREIFLAEPRLYRNRATEIAARVSS